ncbi:MAG: antibiotic biosynthesis monooxygenase [Flavobacterium sp.]|nr:MAG: antibiotic biosynthesis monooxygenase [Flavobacterium sp.]
MITRIVKMTFDPAFVTDFPKVFDKVKTRIAASAGCKGVELHQDISNNTSFFTISHWETEDALNIYRGSLLFKETWGVVKQHFTEKPAAWSLKSI